MPKLTAIEQEEQKLALTKTHDEKKEISSLKANIYRDSHIHNEDIVDDSFTISSRISEQDEQKLHIRVDKLLISPLEIASLLTNPFFQDIISNSFLYIPLINKIVKCVKIEFIDFDSFTYSNKETMFPFVPKEERISQLDNLFNSVLPNDEIRTSLIDLISTPFIFKVSDFLTSFYIDPSYLIFPITNGNYFMDSDILTLQSAIRKRLISEWLRDPKNTPSIKEYFKIQKLDAMVGRRDEFIMEKAPVTENVRLFKMKKEAFVGLDFEVRKGFLEHSQYTKDRIKQLTLWLSDKLVVKDLNLLEQLNFKIGLLKELCAEQVEREDSQREREEREKFENLQKRYQNNSVKRNMERDVVGTGDVGYVGVKKVEIKGLGEWMDEKEKESGMVERKMVKDMRQEMSDWEGIKEKMSRLFKKK